ncbi:MAG TPA: sugar ABC transporter substrate-binding protein [Chthoniobacterales bacterium]
MKINVPLVLSCASFVTASLFPAAGLSTAAAKEKPVIYSIVHGTLSDPFWAVYRKGLQDAASAYGAELRALGTEVHSVQGEVDLFNSALAAKPAGIITTIPDAAAFQEPLERAKNAGIPVIAINVTDTRPKAERDPYLFYIGGDEYLGGQEAAQKVLSVKKPAEAACWIHEPGHTGLEARAKGWTDEMQKAGIKSDTLTFRANNPTEAAAALKGFLTSHPNVDALFAVGPPPASVALEVLNELGKSEKVTLISFDLTQEQVEAIQNGSLLGTIEQQQYLQGYLGIEFMKLYLDHGFVPGGSVLTGPNLVDKANVATVKAQVEAGFR